MLQSDSMLHRRSIDNSISLALSCLRGHFRTVPSGTVGPTAAAGWYHYLDDPTPGITASAVGLYCFSLADVEFERTDQVLDYLVSKQVKTSTGGGWAVRTTNDFPIVEATAWVVRCLNLPQTTNRATRGALDSGIEWLEANQNTDFGWGSYKGQPSRTFTTALSALALRESGGSRSVISDAHKWLIEAQSSSQPAWGPFPGSEPTVLHTSFALLALLAISGSLPVTAINQSIEWLAERLQPGKHVEKNTAVEEYDIPYIHNKTTYTFQNSLPHFATPIALTALLRAGADPFKKEIFEAISEIIRAQETKDPVLCGAGEFGDLNSVWRAIDELGAERIGHGTAVGGCNALASRMRTDQILLEVSVTSNVALGAVAALEAHPLRWFVENNVLACLNTDVPVHLGTTIPMEKRAAERILGASHQVLEAMEMSARMKSFRGRTSGSRTLIGG